MNCSCDVCVPDVPALRFDHYIRHDEEMSALRLDPRNARGVVTELLSQGQMAALCSCHLLLPAPEVTILYYIRR